MLVFYSHSHSSDETHPAASVSDQHLSDVGNPREAPPPPKPIDKAEGFGAGLDNAELDEWMNKFALSNVDQHC
jgi:hypothetical protein